MEVIKIFKVYDRVYFFLIVYVVVAIMLIAYGNVVHKKHRYEDVWYKIGDDEAQCMLFSLLWPLVLCMYLPFKKKATIYFNLVK